MGVALAYAAAMRRWPIFMSLVAGCGSPSSSDPADADRCPDCGPVTVTTRAHSGFDDGAIAPGVSIVSLDGDAVVAEAVTGDDGTATIDVVPGGTLVAVYRTDGGPVVVSYHRVQPGDALTFGDVRPDDQFEPVGTMTASWPEHADATGYVVWTPCAGFGTAPPATSVPMSPWRPCHQDPMTLLYVANTPFDQAVGWALETGVGFVDGGETNITAWNPPTTATLEITAGAIGHVNMYLTGEHGGGTRYTATLRDEAPFFNPGCDPDAGGACGGTEPWVGAPERIVGRLEMNGFAGLAIAEEVTTSPTAPVWSVDGSDLPPDPNALTHDGTGWPILYQSFDGDDAPYDAVQSRYGYQIDPETAYAWIAYLPPDVESVAFPALPAAYDDVAPMIVEGFVPTIALIDIEEVDGFDDFRTLAERDVDRPLDGVPGGSFTRVLVSQ